MRPAILLIVTFLIYSFAHGSGDPCKTPVTVLSSKMDTFYFKLCKDHMGALVEVFSGDSVLLISSTIASNKAIIDFYFEKPGKYVIKITPNQGEEEIEGQEETVGKEETFEYVKVTPPPLAVAHIDYHLVITEQ
jgi:hypothetical protein